MTDEELEAIEKQINRAALGPLCYEGRMARDLLVDSVPRLVAEVRRLRETEAALAKVSQVISGLEGEIAGRRADLASHGKGGQHVPFHGDFVSAVPSVLSKLDWWCRALRKALEVSR